MSRYAMPRAKRLSLSLSRERTRLDAIAAAGKKRWRDTERELREQLAKVTAERDALARWKREREDWDERERRKVA